MKIPPFPQWRQMACAALLGLFLTPMAKVQADEVLASWDVRGSTGFGVSPLAPGITAANISVGGLTRGSGVVTPASGAAGNAWGGTTWVGADAAAAAAAGKYAAFAVTGNAGYKVSFTTIDRFDYRRSGTGPATGVLQYQIGSGNFTDITALAYTASSSAGGSIAPIDLSGITELQFVPASTTVTFRIVNYVASGTGTWYIFDVAGTTAADLSIRGSVVSDSTPGPTITSFTPSSGGVGSSVTIIGTNFGATPTVSFNGTPAPGATVNGAGTSIVVNVPVGATSGPITVTAAGSVTSTSSFAVLAQPALSIVLNPTSILENAGAAATTGTVTASTAPVGNLTITLTSSDTTEATVPATITMLAGQTTATFDVAAVADGVYDPTATVNITATAAGYDNGTAALSVLNVDVTATSVVVNKYMNTPDLIELLVVGTDTPNSTVNMQGMIIKDYSGSMGTDNGGKYVFNSIPLFANVKAGTLITLSTTANSPDTDPSDFTLSLGLLDTTYFTASDTGTVDIATTEMVSIKAATSGASGSLGTIHTLAAGAPGVLFTGAPTPKLIATATTGTALGVIANNSTSSLADFDGTDATGGVSLTAASFGLANNLTNNTYIRRLRGFTNLDGAGLGAITNATSVSPYLSKNIFGRSLTGQAVAISVIADAAPGLITGLRITVPVGFGVPLSANIAVAGAGAGTPVISVSGQQISVSGTAISTSAGVTVTIGGMSTPNPTLATEDGRYTFALETAGTAGTLTAVAASPVAIVTIPVASLRDVTATGVPLDSGKVVAVEAVCTEENFNATGATSAFVQDGDYGINVFGSGITMVLGHKYAVSGSLTQFSGLTEIAPSSAANVIDLGADTLPTPLTITIENLLGAPEAYEGRLVKIVGLSPAPTNTVIWASGATVTLTDGSFNIDARIQAGSSATTVPFYPAAITGIVGQFDSSNPFTSGYQIMPRSDADVVGTAPASYATWIADAYPGVTDPAIVGFSADADGDGIPNGVEYAFALDPKNGEAGALISQGAGSPFFVPFTHRRAKVLPPPVLIKYQWSTDLIQWYDAGASDTNQNVVTIAEDTVDTSNAAYDIVSGHASRDEGSALKVFIRAKVSN